MDRVQLQRILQKEIQESKRWVDKAEGVYKRDLVKRIELMIWVIENMNNDGADICRIIESRMDEILTKIKKTESILELDPLDSELRILNWILYQVSSREIKIDTITGIVEYVTTGYTHEEKSGKERNIVKKN